MMFRASGILSLLPLLLLSSASHADFIVSDTFVQQFSTDTSLALAETQTILEGLFEGYTANITANGDFDFADITTRCEVSEWDLEVIAETLQVVLNVSYTMAYRASDPSGLPQAFLDLVNSNLDAVVNDAKYAGLDVVTNATAARPEPRIWKFEQTFLADEGELSTQQSKSLEKVYAGIGASLLSPGASVETGVLPIGGLRIEFLIKHDDTSAGSFPGAFLKRVNSNLDSLVDEASDAAGFALTGALPMTQLFYVSGEIEFPPLEEESRENDDVDGGSDVGSSSASIVSTCAAIATSLMTVFVFA